jgi:hypothetical protein
MYKTAKVLTVLLVSGAATLSIAGNPVTEVRNAREQERIAQEKLLAYQSFKQIFEETMDALMDRQIDLREAQDRVRAAARRFHPEYFEILSLRETGATDEERLAHNMVGYLRSDAAGITYLEARMSALEVELQDFLVELQVRSNR